jgi:hypothetical protein
MNASGPSHDAIRLNAQALKSLQNDLKSVGIESPSTGTFTVKMAVERLTDVEDSIEAGKLETRKATDDRDKAIAEIAEAKQRRSSLWLQTMTMSTTLRSRVAPWGIPPTEIVKVFGADELVLLARELKNMSSGRCVPQVSVCGGGVHLPAARHFLASEIAAAHAMLNRERMRSDLDLWISDLSAALRENGWDCKNKWELLEESRQTFYCLLRSPKPAPNQHVPLEASLEPVVRPASTDGTDPGQRREEIKVSEPKANVMEALAWAVVVETVLLNERLIQDVNEAAVAKGKCFRANHDTKFYLTPPSPREAEGMARAGVADEFTQASRLFQEYVRCRWPIRVFALDPVTQDQNVADAFARRRELQLAMAIAFASGNIGAQGLMRFNRRLEWDMATIDLNRTVVAFSHGNDTFGWRFQPRFQTPPIKGTLATLGESLLGGPTRDQDIRQRQLEPGMRECTAIVVMPSFVPYATFDVRTNWYKLTNPKCTEISMRDTMRLSRAITAMKNCTAQCIRCAHLYREGEVGRLLRRVEQLDRELPLQTMMVQIPYENTLGGFEMFNRGITDLGPELIGWYGIPGINPSAMTSMFLTGDGFSVQGTRVIAGGRPVEFRLLSRQVMEVRIPPGVQVVMNKEFDPFVDVHVATPYGISQHLMIPVAPREDNLGAPRPLGLKDATVTFWYEDKGKGDSRTRTMTEYWDIEPKELVLRGAGALPAGTATVRIHLLDKDNKKYLGAVSEAFSLDKRSGEYFLTGDSLAKLIKNSDSGMKKLLNDYFGHLTAIKNFGEIHVTTQPELVIDGRATKLGGVLEIKLIKIPSPNK